MPQPDPESAAQASRRRLHPHLHNFSFPIPTKSNEAASVNSTAGRRSATGPAILNSEENPGEEVRAFFADEVPQPAPEKEPGPLNKKRRRRGFAPPLEMGTFPVGTERGCRTRANRQRSEEAERPKFAIALSPRETLKRFICVSLAQAAEFIVGDEKGWTINFNYSTWSEGKEFKVGDKLIFKYPLGKHNVYKVNGTDFKGCTVPPMEEAQPLTSRYDVITLATPGRKWYICGVGAGAHCSTGQKLFVNVQDASASPGWWAPAPAPATSEVPAACPETWAPSPSWDTPAPVPRKIVAWSAPTTPPSADG